MNHLTEQHIQAIELFLEGKTQKQIAETVQVHRNTVSSWLKSDLFKTEIKKIAVTRRQDRLGELVDAIFDYAIRDGNSSIAKLALQINGMLTDKVNITNSSAQESGVDMDKIDALIEADYKRFEAEGEFE